MVAEAEQVTYPPFLDGVYDFPLLLQYGDADPLIPVEVVRQVHTQVRERWGDLTSWSCGPIPAWATKPRHGMAEAIAWLMRYL